MLSRFPDAKRAEKGLTYLSVVLGEVPVKITGFGLPFANAKDAEIEGWVNENKPILNGPTLLDVLTRGEFELVVAAPMVESQKNFDEDRLPPPFSYPYGTEQSWDVARYKEMIRDNKGHQFAATFGYDTDNDHMTVVTQLNVQDVVWLDDEAKAVSSRYFILQLC